MVDVSINAIAALIAAIPDPAPLTDAEEKALAIAAAQQASESALSLLTFVREGPAADWHAFDTDVAPLLAEALRSALQLELPRMGTRPDLDMGGEEQRRANDLLHALNNYLEGWAP